MSLDSHSVVTADQLRPSSDDISGNICVVRNDFNQSINQSIDSCDRLMLFQVAWPRKNHTQERAYFKKCEKGAQPPHWVASLHLEPQSRSRKPLRLAYDSLRLASRLAVVSTAAA